MPKRSNEFQQLIHYIYSQIVPAGATVTESVLLEERNSSTKREVDILIEYEIAGIKLRIAIECRDRSRKDDIEWIDGLIGKYRDLDVHKVIAVSNSGFSEDAIQKAAANKIDTRTLEQALNTDWQKEFIKIGIAKITHQIFIDEIEIEADPVLEDQPDPSDFVAKADGTVICTLHDFINRCSKYSIETGVQEYISQHFLKIFKVLSDLKKILLTEQILEIENAFVLDKHGISHKILSLTFHLRSVFTTEEATVESSTFEQANISTATIDMSETELLNITAVQIAGRKQGRVFMTSKRKK